MGSSGAPASARRKSRDFGIGLPVWARLGWRELRAHRGRALLAALIIGMPIMVLSAAATVYRTHDTSVVEAVPAVMGTAAARVEPGSGRGPRLQDAEGEQAGDVIDMRPDLARSMGVRVDKNGTVVAAPALPGRAFSDPATAQAIQRVTGGRVVPTTWSEVIVDLDDRRPRLRTLAIDGRDPAYQGMASLTSGRWPADAGEVVVTEYGHRRGIPAQGRIDVQDRETGRVRALTVVGSATAAEASGLITLPDLRTGTSFLIVRGAPVTWSDVTDLNRYGLTVQSRHILTHPQTAKVDGAWPDPSSSNRTFVVMLATGTMLLVALLAAPSFSMSGQRQRRLLAQLASNGATPGALRRVVLTQALLIGSLASLCGIGGGVTVGVATSRIWAGRHPESSWGPLDIPWAWLVPLAGLAVACALGAALVPAIQASRVNIIRVMRSSVSARRVRAGWPLSGMILGLGCSFVIFAQLARAGSENAPALLVAATVGLVVGALMTLPWVLAQIGRCASPSPLPLRLALRDIARQRGRSVSAVAAVLGVSTVLVTTSIAAASDAAQGRRDHSPSTVMGHGLAGATSPQEVRRLREAVRSEMPRARLTQIDRVASATPAPHSRVVLPLLAGCAPAAVLNRQCAAAPDSGGPLHVEAMPAELLAEFVGLTPAQTERVRSENVLVVPEPDRRLVAMGYAIPTGIPSGRLPVAYARTVPATPGSDSGTKDRVADVRRLTMSVLTVPMTINSPLVNRGSMTLVTPETAARVGWATSPAWFDVVNPGGISAAQEQGVNDRTDDGINVERGPDTDVERTLLRIFTLTIAMIALIAAVTSTILNQSERRPDQATLAAVGASPGLSRSVSAVYAAVVSLVGIVIGAALGAVPGIAMTQPLTAPLGGRPMIAMPWVELLGYLVCVPLVAALVAWFATCSRQTLTRRST